MGVSSAVEGRQVRRAEEDAYTDFYTSAWPGLFRLTYAISGDAGEAEDAVQSAMTKAYVSWHRVSSARHPEAYVRKMAVNEVLRVRRRSWWRSERSGQVPDTGGISSSEVMFVDRADLWAELLSLAPRQRAVLVLRYYEDLSERQIAEVGAPGRIFLLACLEGELVGYASLRESPVPEELKGENAIEIVQLYSDQRMIGKGVGPALMQACLDTARNLGKDWVWLGVWEHNHRAQAFYAKWGFERFGEHIFIVGLDAQTDWWLRKRL